MKILNNGFFAFTYNTGDLSKGLRATDKLPRNNKQLTTCAGAVGNEGTLSTLDTVAIHAAMVNVGVVLDDFPFPQLFVTDKHVIVCNKTSILELVDGALVVQISGLTEGNMWDVAGSSDFVYLSNGVVSVVRDPNSQLYTIDTTAPKSSAVCNFNGQILVGASR